MSEQTPSPEDAGGRPGDARSGDEPGVSETAASPAATPPAGGDPAAAPAGTQPGFGPESGYGTQPGYGPQPGYGTQAGPTTQPGYTTQPGQTTQPGYAAAPPPYGTPGYAQPGPGGGYPPPPQRGRARLWLGMIGGIVVLALVIAGVSAYLLKKPKRWVLSAPQAVAGMRRDTNPFDRQGFTGAVSKFRSDVTSLPNYGSLASTVSALYTLGTSQTVGFVGFNGNFKVQVVLKSANGLKVTSVSAGSHGGTAECGVSVSETICQWATSSTVGIVVIIPTGSATAEPAATGGKLMLKVRDQVEKPAH
jgi:hypothetical protein